MNGQAESGGTEIPGLMYMYLSTEQDKGMRMVVIRPRDSINLLDLGLSVKSVFNYDIINKVIGVELSSNFGPPVSDMTGELVSNRFQADGTPKTTYGNYTVVAVGTKAGGPQVPTGASDLDTLFLFQFPNHKASRPLKTSHFQAQLLTIQRWVSFFHRNAFWV